MKPGVLALLEVNLVTDHLWQWLREDVTYHNCYDSKAALIKQVVWFEQQINAFPQAICERLWVTTHLQPEQEKLRISP
ncbi:MAG: hypothetical protein ACLGGO_09105 [Coleofasciculus sp.]